jgi:HEPN domain-containing protein
MKNPEGMAQRWFKQAQHDGEVAQKHLKDGYFSDACFMAEQTAQKALKAYLFWVGERHAPEHSLVALIQKCSRHHPSFVSLAEACRQLDRLYIPTRYPDAWPDPAVPYEGYGEREATEAIQTAQQILGEVEKKLQS